MRRKEDLVPALAPTRTRGRCRSATVSDWTPKEEELLVQLVSQSNDWNEIASHFEGRTSKQCQIYWQKVANPLIVRGSWTLKEDQQVIDWVQKNGPSKWTVLADLMPGRNAKQCRERWFNHLNPNIKSGNWTPEEDSIIVQMIQNIGTKWAAIARKLPGRTDNSVKNRWNSTLKRRNPTLDAPIPPVLRNSEEFKKNDFGTSSLAENRRKLEELLRMSALSSRPPFN